MDVPDAARPGYRRDRAGPRRHQPGRERLCAPVLRRPSGRADRDPGGRLRGLAALEPATHHRGRHPAAGTPLAALDAETGGGQQEIFFTDRRGRLAEVATGPAGIGWQARELPGTPSGTLLAQNYLPSSGAPAAEVFYRTASRAPAVTYASGQAGNSGQAWDSGTLPGTATALLGAAAYPATQSAAPAGTQPASQSDRLFLADGSGVTADTAAVPAGPWTAATLPATAATFAGRVMLYAATTADDQSAVAAASAAGLPATQVTQSFTTAWADA